MPKVKLPPRKNAYRFRGAGHIDVIAELPEAAAQHVREGHEITVTVEWHQPTDSEPREPS